MTDDVKKAETLAKLIALDLSVQARLNAGADLSSQVDASRTVFRSRVSPILYPMFERALHGESTGGRLAQYALDGDVDAAEATGGNAPPIEQHPPSVELDPAKATGGDAPPIERRPSSVELDPASPRIVEPLPAGAVPESARAFAELPAPTNAAFEPAAQPAFELSAARLDRSEPPASFYDEPAEPQRGRDRGIVIALVVLLLLAGVAWFLAR